jgi:hypothetical protein
MSAAVSAGCQTRPTETLKFAIEIRAFGVAVKRLSIQNEPSENNHRRPHGWSLWPSPGGYPGDRRWIGVVCLICSMVPDEIGLSSHRLQSRFAAPLKSQIGKPSLGRLSLICLSDQVFSR